MSESINLDGRRFNGGTRPGAGRPWKVPTSPIPLALPVGPRWCVYQTEPNTERAATHELSRSGYRTYLPLIAVRRHDPTIPTMVTRVLAVRFPGYGFASLAPVDQWARMLKVAYVRGLLLTDGHPHWVADGEVERHMSEDAHLCDLARETAARLPAGTSVLIAAGPFAGFTGSVLECDGMTSTVEVEMFGRLMPVRLDRLAVGPVPT